MNDTVGKISSNLLIQQYEDQHSAHDQMLEQLSEYDKELFTCIENANLNSPFYVVVLTKQEKLMRNVMRNYFLARQSCPTPNYDQAVYKVNKDNFTVDLLWVLPSKETAVYLSENALTIDKEEFDLLEYVLKDKDGSLLKLAKKLNGESSDSIILEK